MTKRYLVMIGTLDTKGPETAFLRDCLHSLEWETRIMDAGLLSPPTFPSDVTREEVAVRAGTTIEALLAQKGDKVDAIESMARGVTAILNDWVTRGEVAGVIAMGGGVGTWLGAAVMRALPLGLPKVMVSTVPFQDIRPLLGTKDIVFFPSVADILGLNPLLRTILRHAAGALVGMANLPPVEKSHKRVIGTTSLGITTPAVLASREILEGRGYEVTCYHANGYGGRAFEEGIGAGMFSAVLDLTTHEITNQLFSGVGIASPDRLETAARTGIPQVVAPGGVDVISRGPIDTLRPSERKRPHYRHSPFFTHVRTSARQMRQVGEAVAEKLNRSHGACAVVIPLRGFSDQNRPGGLFYDPQADGEFVSILKKRLDPRIRLVEIDAHMNDKTFASRTCELLGEIMDARGARGPSEPEGASVAAQKDQIQ
jgi:uncharacterized protein (UPF0261 family)